MREQEVKMFEGEKSMEIKQYHVYNMGYKDNSIPIEVVVVQNNLANSDINYDQTMVIYLDSKNTLGGLYNVKKSDLKFEVRALSEEEKQEIVNKLSELFSLN